MGDKANERQVLVPLGLTGSVVLSGVLRRWFDEEEPDLNPEVDKPADLIDWFSNITSVLVGGTQYRSPSNG